MSWTREVLRLYPGESLRTRCPWLVDNRVPCLRLRKHALPDDEHVYASVDMAPALTE